MCAGLFMAEQRGDGGVYDLAQDFWGRIEKGLLVRWNFVSFKDPTNRFLADYSLEG
jgi:hypothetical protein